MRLTRIPLLLGPLIVALAAICVWRFCLNPVVPRQILDDSTMRHELNLIQISLLITLSGEDRGTWPTSLSQAVDDVPDMLHLGDFHQEVDQNARAATQPFRQLKTFIEDHYQYVPPTRPFSDFSKNMDSTRPSPNDGDVILLEKRADSVGNRLYITCGGKVWIAHQPGSPTRQP
jgi:hypothetical protein